MLKNIFISISKLMLLLLFATSKLFAQDTVATVSDTVATVKDDTGTGLGTIIKNIKNSNVDTDQRILFQFEEMLYNNWEGDGFNYVAGSLRYIGRYNRTSVDSAFRWLNNAEAVIGTAYNSTDKWGIQENKISATSSANQQFFRHLNFNGTADLKSRFDLSANYLLGALGASFIKGELVIQENPITLRATFPKNQRSSLKFGNYFRVAWKGTLDDNITQTVRLENFYEYGTVFWKESYWNFESMTSFQINRIITSHIILCALLDLNQSKKLQSYQKVTIGFSWTL